MRQSTPALTLIAAAALVSAACSSNVTTPFPPGIEPLEVSTATRPTSMSGQRCPESVNVVTGNRGSYEFAHARGCVHAPFARVWEAMRDPDVAVDRRRTHEWMVTRAVEQQYPVSFRVHNIVRDIITIEFDLTWRGGVIEGDDAAPRTVSMRYQKTFGSDFIMTLSGSMVARPLDADTTEVELVRHIKSTGAGAAEAELYLRDVHASLVARVQGRPLPRYN